jgi:hypothetical protein
MSKFNRHTQYEKELTEMTSHFMRCKDHENPGVVLRAIPSEYDARNLSRIKNEDVPFAAILEHLSKHHDVSADEIYALKKQKHMEIVRQNLDEIKSAPTDLLREYINEIKDNLDGAGYSENYDAGLATVNSSLDKIQKALVENCTQYSKSYDDYEKAKLLFSIFSAPPAPATNATLEPYA